jgi:molybdopterin converting factor small subunit
MRLTVRLSPSLQTSINGQLELMLKGTTIRQCIEHGRQNFSELRELLFKADKLNPQILLFHNNTLIREHNLSNQVNDKDVLDIIPAIEGG